MNNIEELKKAANAIGYEKWIDSAGEVTSVDYLAGGDVTCDHICNCESFNGESANAKFIALANPAAILDLIAQLEAAQKVIKNLEGKVNHYVSAEYAHKHFDQTPDIIKRADSAELELAEVKSELSAANEKLSKPVVLSPSTVMSRACAVRAIEAAGFTVEGE